MKQEVKDKIVEIIRHMNQLQEACGMPKLSVGETLMFQQGFTDGYEYAAQFPQEGGTVEGKPINYQNRVAVGNTMYQFMERWAQGDSPEILKEATDYCMSLVPYPLSATDKKRIEELAGVIDKLQEKYDENGYELPPVIKLQRIEQHIDSAFSIYCKRIEELEKAWVRVEDGLPEAGEVLLFTTSKCIYKGDRYLGKWRVNGFWEHNGTEWISRMKDEDVTHYMPLPEPSKQ